MQKHQADLDAHAASIDALHAKLAADPNVDQEKLAAATKKFKAAFSEFVEDAQQITGARG